MNSKNNVEKMISSPIPKLIISLSIPAIISNLISNIYNLVDTFFVGTLGVSASGATGVIFTLMAILQALAFMLGQGAGTNISRHLSVYDEERSSSYASVSFYTSVILGCLILILGLIFLKPLALILGSTETVLPYAMEYGKYILIAAPAIMGSLVLNNIFRYEGKTYLGMIGLSIGAIINIAGDPLFIYVFNMGIGGAGLATAISQYISFFVLIILFYRKSACKISWLRFTSSFSLIVQIVKNGFPSFIRQSLNSISSGLLNNFAKINGDDCLSAVSIVGRIQGFMVSVGLGLGQGFQPVAGYNYGVKDYNRLKKSFDFTLYLSLAIFSCNAVLCLIFAPTLLDIFIDSSRVVEIGTPMLRFTCIGFLFLPLSTVANMLFQSTGQSLKASILSCLRSGVCFIPCLIVLYSFFGLIGIQLSTGCADILAGLISLPFFIIYFKDIQNKNNLEEHNS